MSEWIKGEARKILEAMAATESSQQKELKERELVERHWADHWQALADGLTEQIGMFNEHLKGETRHFLRFEVPSATSFHVSRDTDVTIVLKIAAGPAGLKFERIVTRSDRSQHTSDQPPMPFRASSDGNTIGLSGPNGKVMAADKGAETILKSLFNS